MATMRIYKEFKFDAAHRLPRVNEGHKCGNLHGHTFVVIVYLEGEVDPEKGWILDFNILREAVEPVIEELDHTVLNEIPGLENPTSENLSVWLWNRLKPQLPLLSMIEVKENSTSGCIYCGN